MNRFLFFLLTLVLTAATPLLADDEYPANYAREPRFKALICYDPSPRKDKDVEVFLSITPANYPFGIKDVVLSGDFPIVWSNTRYRMIYLNMGHGNEGFIDATQNLLFTNAFRWVVSQDPHGDPFTR